jgi:23S rRNA (guanosine2251-2'-O)-methyltransferase
VSERGPGRPARRPRASAAGRETGAGRTTGAPADGLIYGRNPIREALLAGRRELNQVWVAAGKNEQVLRADLAAWARAAGSALPRLRTASLDELDRRAGSAEHQGLVAETAPYPYADLSAVLGRDLVVALDRVQDPHNLGAVIRTAEAAGAAVVIPRHRAAGVTPAAVKASAGASEHALVAQVANLTAFLEAAKERGLWVYGAAAEAEAAYDGEDYSRPTLFVLGSEGRGLARLVAERCDVLVSVPLAGQVESLNVSVTAGILLFEARRQRKAAVGERTTG